MIRETVYTGIGATALAVEFVTSPSRLQNWLKRAERRGGRLAQSGRLQVRPYQRRLDNLVGDVRHSTLSAIGLAEDRVEEAGKTARRTARKTATRARRNTPRVTVSTRRAPARRAGSTRRVRRTSVSVQTPASKAS
ncbi:MAG: hypothetical protein M3010_03285 [Candidatus Dormibacteraeota bacterium]|nr:hypothetical protein [Candidatus Dormibacteraeota bacterium]